MMVGLQRAAGNRAVQRYVAGARSTPAGTPSAAAGSAAPARSDAGGASPTSDAVGPVVPEVAESTAPAAVNVDAADSPPADGQIPIPAAETPGTAAALTAIEPMDAATMPALEVEDTTTAAPTGAPPGTPMAVQLDVDPLGAITGAARSVARGVGDLAAGAFDAVKGQISSLVGGLSSGWSALQGAAGQIVGSVTGAVSSGVQTVVGLGTQAAGTLQAGFQRASQVVSGAGHSLMGMVTRGVGQLGGAASSLKSALMAMDGEALRAAYHRLTGMLTGVFGTLQKGRDALTAQVSALWGGLERGFSTTIGAVRARADAVGQQLRVVADDAGRRLSGLWDGLRQRADGMSGMAGTAARLAAAAVDRLLAGARALWDSIQARFETVRAGLGRVVAGISEQVGGAWDAVQRSAGVVWSGITGAWGAARGAVEGVVGTAVWGVGEMLGKFKGFAIDPVVDKVTAISGLLKAVRTAASDPEGTVGPILQPISARLEAGMPAAGHQKLAEQAGAGASGGAGPVPAVQREATAEVTDERSTLTFGRAFDLIGAGLEKGWAQVHPAEMLWKTVKTLLWPWPTVWDEVVGIWDDWKVAAAGLFSFREGAGFWGWLHDLWSNFLHLIDFPLIVWRRLNNIGLALWGWITLALMAVGAFGGTIGGSVLGAIGGFLFGLGIGAAPGAGAGAGAGGLAGAGAGLTVALAVGEGFVVSFLAAELLSLVKAVTELTTARQTRDEQVGDAATASENVISMGVTLVLMGIGWLGGKVAGVIASFVRRLLPEAVLEAFARFRKGVVDSGPNPAKTRYESIDPTTAPAKMDIVDHVTDTTPDGKPTRITTEVSVGGDSGHVTRSYDPATGKLTMEEAFLDKIPEAGQMVDVEGQKMRLQQYITLRQMRAFGIGFGKLRVVKMSTIQNIRALIEMHLQLKAGLSKDAAVMKTHSVQYAQRTLAGGGETVTSAKVSNGVERPIGDLTDHYERIDPSRKPVYDDLLNKNGLARDTKMFQNYDIELTVEASPTRPGGGNGAVVPAPSKDDDE